MESQMAEILDIMKEGDAHFVLAVGNKDDWIAMIHKDETPDEPICWGVAEDPYSAVDLMLTNASDYVRIIHEDSVAH